MNEQNSSGDTANENASGVSDQNSVAYETHKKLLGEKKSLQSKFQEQAARLAELESHIEQQKTEQLEQQKKYQDLYEQEKNKRSLLENSYNELNRSIVNNNKKSALRDALGGKIKDAYLNLADLGSISVNEDGSVDSESVQAVAAKFKDQFPEALGSPKEDVPGTTSQPPYNNRGTTVDLSKLTSQQRTDLLAEAIKREGK